MSRPAATVARSSMNASDSWSSDDEREDAVDGGAGAGLALLRDVEHPVSVVASIVMSRVVVTFARSSM